MDPARFANKRHRHTGLEISIFSARNFGNRPYRAGSPQARVHVVIAQRIASLRIPEHQAPHCAAGRAVMPEPSGAKNVFPVAVRLVR